MSRDFGFGKLYKLLGILSRFGKWRKIKNGFHSKSRASLSEKNIVGQISLFVLCRADGKVVETSGCLVLF